MQRRCNRKLFRKSTNPKRIMKSQPYPLLNCLKIRLTTCVRSPYVTLLLQLCCLFNPHQYTVAGFFCFISNNVSFLCIYIFAVCSGNISCPIAHRFRTVCLVMFRTFCLSQYKTLVAMLYIILYSFTMH